MPERAAIAAEARSWVGTPYRHLAGAAPMKGVACDCLGLIRGMWMALYGFEPETPPAYSPDWAEGTGEETLLAAAGRHMSPIGEAPAMTIAAILAACKPGDMLLFRWRPNLPAKHAGVLVAENPWRMVHAWDGAGKVAEGNLAAQWRGRIVAAFAFPETA